MSEEVKILYNHRLVMLTNGDLLLGGLVMNHENAKEILCIMTPMLIDVALDMNTGHTHIGIRPWVPESDDKFFFIPYDKVMNVSNPSEKFNNVYKDYLKNLNKPVKKEAQPDTTLVNPEGVDLEDMIPNKSSIFH